MIGAFVVGAVAIAVLAVIILGVGQMFSKTYPFILYFGGDLNGLKAGAPVKFRGVEIGAVTDMRLRMGEAGFAAHKLPVVIEIDEQRIQESGGRANLKDPNFIKSWIDQGMRGQLAVESLVTGVRYVRLDLFPQSPVEYHPDPEVKYTEIPTVPTPMEELQSEVSALIEKLDKIDLAGLVKSFTNVANSVNELLSTPELKTALKSLNPVIENTNRAVIAIRAMTESMDGNVDSLSQKLLATAESADAALQQANVALQQAKTTFAAFDSTLQADSPFMNELGTSLARLSGAARSLRSLADYLERNPDALLRGKPERVEAEAP
ncbi:MAG: MlaD family protein [bacterium]